MMTIIVDFYASRPCHNSRKYRNPFWLPVAVTVGLVLLSQAAVAAGNADGRSMYIAPSVQEAPPASGKAAPPASREAAPHVERHAAPAGLVDMVSEAARRHGVPVALAHAIIKIESGYNCRAHSPNGAQGIGQILPATARAEGVTGNLYECSTGLEASMRYLAHALESHGGGCEGASAYNTGLAAPRRCTGYGRKAMQLARLL
jgi:soluble lytic murein transglycosylase-like protein